MKVLIVEDDPLDRMLTRRTLNSLSLECEFVTLENGQELVDYVQGINLDDVLLILMDLKMPKMGGLEALEILNQQELTRQIPVVFLSSSSMEADIDAAYKLGARAFLTKPIRHAEFEEAIRGIGLFWCKYNKLPKVV